MRQTLEDQWNEDVEKNIHSRGPALAKVSQCGRNIFERRWWKMTWTAEILEVWLCEAKWQCCEDLWLVETSDKLLLHRWLVYVGQCHLLIFMEKPTFFLSVCMAVLNSPCPSCLSSPCWKLYLYSSLYHGPPKQMRTLNLREVIYLFKAIQLMNDWTMSQIQIYMIPKSCSLYNTWGISQEIRVWNEDFFPAHPHSKEASLTVRLSPSVDFTCKEVPFHRAFHCPNCWQKGLGVHSGEGTVLTECSLWKGITCIWRQLGYAFLSLALSVTILK